MTFEEATRQLEAARDAVPGAVDASIVEVGNQAVDQIAAAWPRDTGESADAWAFRGGAVVNDVPYAAYVHDGLADRLVPETLQELEPTFGELVKRRIDAVAGG